MAQHKLSSGKLLNEQGLLNEAGYSTTLIKEYNRNDIKAGKSRIKEWDYYYIGDENYGIALTIDDNSYMGMASVSVLDFKNKKHYTKSPIQWLTFGEVKLPSTSEDGDTYHSGKGFSMYFKNEKGKRRIICSMKNVAKGKDFSCDVTLTKTTDDSMVIVTPFDKPKYFYYNQKINCLKARGYFKFGELTYQFKGASYGVLDWGRGVWTYSNTWYWASLNSEYNGKVIGFNLGYGFGDTSAASENMLFFDGKAYKFEDVTFNIPLDQKGKEDYMGTWTFTSKSQDIYLTFVPVIDRFSDTNAIVIQSKQHQVFGLYSGYFLVDGEKIEFKNLLGFAERVKNRW